VEAAIRGELDRRLPGLAGAGEARDGG